MAVATYDRESFTSQKRLVATEQDCRTAWGGVKNGGAFRCYLCGHKFSPGDGFRWVYTGGLYFETEEGKRYATTNFMTCDACDGDDVKQRWLDKNKEFYSAKYWALR